MRLLAVAFLLLGLAVPASAQSRYVEACVASSADEPSLDRAGAETLCACSADRALSNGLAAARLDALVDYADPEAGYDLDLEGAPEAVQETALIVVGSLMECLLTQGMEEMVEAFATAASEGMSASSEPVSTKPKTGETASTPASAPAVAPRSGIRTGNGTGTVLSTQQGSGAAVRIVD
ncbi:MAG: hypothetical protein AAF845_16585 [Bacteroidota bacterium]